jgi:hypothetical protein
VLLSTFKSPDTPNVEQKDVPVAGRPAVRKRVISSLAATIVLVNIGLASLMW